MQYSSPVLEMHDRISFGGGVVKDTLVLGVSPQYRNVRNLVVLAGRFFDDEDETAHIKCAVVTVPFAREMFGSSDDAIGRDFQISGIPFTIIGTSKKASTLWRNGNRRRDHPHSLLRGPLLHRHRQREADLLLDAHHGRSARSATREIRASSVPSQARAPSTRRMT